MRLRDFTVGGLGMPGRMGGMGFGGGRPGMGAGTPGTPITQEKWFPELYNLMFGRLQGGQRNMMNQITGNLGRTMGRHLSRTNVAVPVGMDALARRYMSPLSQAMEARDPMRMMGQAQTLAGMFAPGFKAGYGEKRDPTRYLGQYMNRLWGGY